MQKASRHPSHGGLAVCSRGGVYAKGQAQAETGIPVVAAATAACPECPLLPICPEVLESAGASGIEILQSVYSPFLLPCVGLGQEQAGIRLVLSRGEDGRIWKLFKLPFIFLPCQCHEPCTATATKLNLPCTDMKS